MSPRSSDLIVECNLQLKRKWIDVSVSGLHLHIGLTVSLKPSLNLYSLKRLNFNLRRASSLIPLVSCIAKTEFTLDLVTGLVLSEGMSARVHLQFYRRKISYKTIVYLPKILSQCLNKDDHVMHF